MPLVRCPGSSLSRFASRWGGTTFNDYVDEVGSRVHDEPTAGPGGRLGQADGARGASRGHGAVRRGEPAVLEVERRKAVGGTVDVPSRAGRP